MFMNGIRQILERVSPVFEIMHLAAKSELEIAAQRGEVLADKLEV